MKRPSQTESPIFVILCVLCFQRQSLLTFISYVAFFLSLFVPNPISPSVVASGRLCFVIVPFPEYLHLYDELDDPSQTEYKLVIWNCIRIMGDALIK